MTDSISQMPKPQVPTLCNFWWNADGPPISYTVGGETFPYQHQADNVHRASDYRYEILTTPLYVSIAFDAIGAASATNPKVIPPPGVTVTQYLWNFGDGTIGYGPQPAHTFTAASPDTQVNLTVTDSRGLQSSCGKPLNLIYLQLAAEIAYKIRH